MNEIPVPESPYANASLWVIASRIIAFLWGVSGIVAIVFLIIGGYRYITSGGNQEKIDQAKRAVFAAIFGLIIVLLSAAIVYLVYKIFGIEVIKLELSNFDWTKPLK